MGYVENWKDTKWIDLNMTMMLTQRFFQLLLNFMLLITLEETHISSFKSALGTAWEWNPGFQRG